MSISATIKSVQDIMRQDAGVDGDAQRISQLVWMLFLKVFDSKEKEWDALSDDYTYIIPDGLRWSDWAEDDEGITGDELIDFANNTLFKTKPLRLYINSPLVFLQNAGIECLPRLPAGNTGFDKGIDFVHLIKVDLVYCVGRIPPVFGRDGH